MAFLRNLFSRPKPQSHSPAVRDADPLAFYLGGDGRLQAVKSSGYITSNALGRTGLGYVAAHAEQYAKAAIASVWANNCIALRADTMARFEWFVQNKHTKDKVADHPFTHALYNSKQNILRVMERRILIYGELFLKPLHNEHGLPSGFHALNNLDVEVDDSLGYINHFRYTPNGTRQQQIYFPRSKGDYRQQIVYIHNDNEFDDHRGISRFESILLEIGIDVDISRATASFYKNDARPGLLLIPEMDLTLEQSEEFVDFWNAQFKGSQNAGRTALVPKVIKEIREFQRAPSIDDVELRESTRREICAAFKVPLSMAGAWDDATYQSLPEQRKFFYEETMIPAADAHAEDLTKNALPFFDDSGENEVAYDASTILALVENAAEKVDIHTKKLQSGAYTINEYREFNGDDPIDGGDIYLHQSGWIPVRADELATYEAPNTQQAPEDPLLEEVPAPNTPLLEAQNPPTRHDHTHSHEPVLYVADETIEVKTVHEAALTELRAWQKFHANDTKSKRPFKNEMIRDDIADTLRENLIAVGNDSEAIKACFKAAEEAIAVKQADVVRSNFELEMKTLIDIGRAGSLKRIDFTNRLKTALYKYGADGMIAGLADGGVIINDKNEFTAEDAATFESLYAEQSRHAVSLSEQVYSGRLTDAQALLKPRQWFGGSIQPFYDAGLLSAARNGMVEFVGTIDGNSCATCKALVGQRHRRRMFAQYGFNPPYGSGIICSDGNLCKHRLISINSRARGNLSRVPRK